MAEKYTTLGQSTLSAAYTSGGVLLELVAAASFPAGGVFRVRVDDEIFKITAVAGDDLTCVGAQEGTAAANHANGATVTEVLTAEALDAIRVDQCGTGVDSALPAVEKAGRLYLPTDSHVVYRDTGAAQERFQMQHVDFQPLSGLTWLNQTASAVTATADDSMGVLKLFCPALSGPNLRVLKKAATPISGAFTFEVQIFPLILAVGFHRSGILLRESATGKMLLMICGAGDINKLWVERWTNFNAGGLAQLTSPNVAPGHGCWLKFVMDGTNVKCYYGTWGSKGNPGYWIEILSEAKNASFTTEPDEIGICVDPNNSAFGCGLHVGTWKEF